MERRYQILFFQCSRSQGITSSLRIISNPPSSVTSGCCQWRFYVSFPGWPQENSYRNRRSSRAERGGPALQPRPGANCLSRPRYRKIKMRVSYEKAPRVPQGRKAVRYPVNDMAGMWRPQEGAAYRKRWASLSHIGFRLSLDHKASINVKPVGGRRSLWKNGNAAAFSGFLFFCVCALLCVVPESVDKV